MLCSVHCACSTNTTRNTLEVEKDRRRQLCVRVCCPCLRLSYPYLHAPFVIAHAPALNVVLACTYHAPTCARPSSLHMHLLCTSCLLFSVVVITVCAEILSPYPLLSISSAQPALFPPYLADALGEGYPPPLRACHVCICVRVCVYVCVSACVRVCACEFVVVCARACIRVCERVCMCVCACVHASACVRVRARMPCLCACTYACVCLRPCVHVSVCAFPSYLQYVPRKTTSATASLSQRRGFAHAGLGLEHFGYIP